MSEVYVPHQFVSLNIPNFVVTAWKVSELLRLYDMELPPDSKLQPFILNDRLIIEKDHVELNLVERVDNPDARIVTDGSDIFGVPPRHFEENYAPITLVNPDPVDPVNHPAHYTRGKIEVWDFIIDQELNYCSGNIVKYVCRAGEKSSETHIQDLEKAKAYLEREIRRVKDLG